MFDDDIFSVLPRHSTELERALEKSSLWVIRNSAIPKLWNPEECPEDFLPWLGWGLSVDRWEPEWGADRKRVSVRNSVSVHRQKGTLGAILRTLEAFGHDAELEEWREYGGAPHAFRLWVEASEETSLDLEYVSKVRASIDAVKPVRSYYDVSFRFTETCGIYAGGYSRVQVVANAPAKAFSVPTLTASAGPRFGLETHIRANAEAMP